MFKYYTKKLEDFIRSDRYTKTSTRYQICKSNTNDYLIFDIHCNAYVDLVSGIGHIWSEHDKYIKDCLGSPYCVLRKYKKITKHIKPELTITKL